jgi:hypothetical protein
VELPPALVPVIRYLARRDLHERVAHRGVQRREARQLTGRPIDGELDGALIGLELFYARRGKLEELCKDELGAIAMYADR